MYRLLVATWVGLLACGATFAGYVNFEVSHVHPIALTPSGNRLLVVNTPDAMLEVFEVLPDGGLSWERSIPVGLEPVSVAVRGENEAWVVNQLSDSITVLDPGASTPLATVRVGDEPSDVAFAAGRAFVSIAGENVLRVLDPDDLTAAQSTVPLFSLKPRALAVSADGTKVYAVPLFSGNRTTVLNANVIFGLDTDIDGARLAALGLNGIDCDGAPPPYPPLPPGIERNPALTDPPPEDDPPVALIVRWNEATDRWEGPAGQDWSHCLPYRLPDHDLFVVDANSLSVETVDHLGTNLFEVSVNPADGKIWIPHTDSRNHVRFEHPLGVRGHVVDNRMAVVNPADANAVTSIDLNDHIDRASDPASNLVERLASVSQPGMMVWNSAGTKAWLSAIGSRRVFRVNGGCASADCILGETRAAPDAVEVGGGPTGVALHEARQRLYVLLRFANSLAVVDTETLTKIEEVPLHDPSPEVVREGRRMLYDAIDGSGHGDAACSSCHLSGDRDGLAWDLGDPTGEFVPYSTPMDNVRFIAPFGGQPITCSPEICASHEGFDPQKGPMTTQTLRGMLEPLHWRGDRATMNDFNAAFVNLMGTADIGPIDGKPAGIPAVEMERFRQFALGIAYPPNPLRDLDDGLPNELVPVPGSPWSGNPAVGATLFDTFPADANQPCATCHTRPFGAGGGRLGGVTPTEPTSPDAAALFNGDADKSPHSDLKIPHLRNMHEKSGPRFGPSPDAPIESRTGFGFTHDGAVPDMGTFLSFGVFDLNTGQVRDLAAFMAHFPTGTRPATGYELMVPAGAGPVDDPALTTLLAVGDAAGVSPHCELTASALVGGSRRHYRLLGGYWLPDAAGEPAVTLSELRQSASTPLHLLCAPPGSGVRLGNDRDEDSVFNADDCAPAAQGSFAETSEVEQVSLQLTGGTMLSWQPQALQTGSDVRYELLGGGVAQLRSEHSIAGMTSLASGLEAPAFFDSRPAPPPGDGHYYLVRAANACGTGPLGNGR